MKKILLVLLTSFFLTACCKNSSENSGSTSIDNSEGSHTSLTKEYSFEDYRIAEIEGSTLDCKDLSTMKESDERYRHVFEYERVNKYVFTQCRNEIKEVKDAYCKNALEEKRFTDYGDNNRYIGIISKINQQNCELEIGQDLERLKTVHNIENIFVGDTLLNIEGYDDFYDLRRIYTVNKPFNKLTNQHWVVELDLIHDSLDPYIYFGSKEDAMTFVKELSNRMAQHEILN